MRMGPRRWAFFSGLVEEHDVTGNVLIIEPRGIRIRRAKP